MKNKIIILGAGIGGISAGSIFDDSIIIEKQNAIPDNLPNGLHYLHSIPEIETKIKFKKIPHLEFVINVQGKISQTPSALDAMSYSHKTTGIIQPTSIFDIGKTHDYYAPESLNLSDLTNDLAKKCSNRLKLGEEVTSIDKSKKIVMTKSGKEFSYDYLLSTIPLKYLIKFVGIDSDAEFKSSPIYIYNFEVINVKPDWLIYCYIADPTFSSYRMTIFNGKISVESYEEINNKDVIREINEIFPFVAVKVTSMSENYSEKILSISANERERIVKKLLSHDIIPFGRYGVWNRKILIDSTISQANAIKKYTDKEITKEELIKILCK